MKNLLFSFAFLFAFSLSNNLNAQNSMPSSHLIEEATNINKVEILTNFKASKNQKKVIRKIKKYVSTRFLKRTTPTAGLTGKTVKVQINTDKNGLISAISVIEGQGVKIDNRVVELIKAYDAKQPISKTKVKKSTVLQLDIPLVGKQYFIRD